MSAVERDPLGEIHLEMAQEHRDPDQYGKDSGDHGAEKGDPVNTAQKAFFIFFLFAVSEDIQEEKYDKCRRHPESFEAEKLRIEVKHYA